MEFTNAQIEEFKLEIGDAADGMTHAELKRAMFLLDKLADLLFDEWVDGLRGASHIDCDEV